MKTGLSLLGLFWQIFGVIFLYIAAIEIPWAKRTLNGESKEEKAYRGKQLILGRSGLILVLIGSVLRF